jgi:hypothetical protein
VDLEVLCDWIEGSVLFDDLQVSGSEVVDVLCENAIYDEQDFAWEIVNDAWRLFERRLALADKGSPFKITGMKLERVATWESFPAHSFCLVLSFARLYPEWARRFGSDYTEQGELFERLTCESLMRMFPDWKIRPTGWTKANPMKLAKVVEEVAAHLGERMGDVDHWIAASANDAGLDVLCHRPFGDDRAGIPVYLLQCASGCNWEGKLTTPNLDVWAKIVDFTTKPQRAFAMPFALADDDFRYKCVLVGGMLLDRYRLLSAGRADPDWVSKILKKDLNKWARPRIKQLLREDH